MTNAEKIRQFDDKQLARFLWIWKINSISTFLANGGMGSMNGKDMYEWLDQTTDTFVCTETFVGDDYIFDQDFRDKQADTPQTEDYDFRDEQEYNDRWNTDCPWK